MKANFLLVVLATVSVVHGAVLPSEEEYSLASPRAWNVLFMWGEFANASPDVNYACDWDELDDRFNNVEYGKFQMGINEFFSLASSNTFSINYTSVRQKIQIPWEFEGCSTPEPREELNKGAEALGYDTRLRSQGGILDLHANMLQLPWCGARLGIAAGTKMRIFSCVSLIHELLHTYGFPHSRGDFNNDGIVAGGDCDVMGGGYYDGNGIQAPIAIAKQWIPKDKLIWVNTSKWADGEFATYKLSSFDHKYIGPFAPFTAEQVPFAQALIIEDDPEKSWTVTLRSRPKSRGVGFDGSACSGVNIHWFSLSTLVTVLDEGEKFKAAAPSLWEVRVTEIKDDFGAAIVMLCKDHCPKADTVEIFGDCLLDGKPLPCPQNGEDSLVGTKTLTDIHCVEPGENLDSPVPVDTTKCSGQYTPGKQVPCVNLCLPTPVVNASQACEDFGFQHILYSKLCFNVTREYLTFPDAKARCEMNGGHLCRRSEMMDPLFLASGDLDDTPTLGGGFWVDHLGPEDGLPCAFEANRRGKVIEFGNFSERDNKWRIKTGFCKTFGEVRPSVCCMSAPVANGVITAPPVADGTGNSSTGDTTIASAGTGTAPGDIDDVDVSSAQKIVVTYMMGAGFVAMLL